MRRMKKRIIEMTGKRIKKNIKQYQSSKCSPKFTYPSRKPRELIGFLITCDYFYLKFGFSELYHKVNCFKQEFIISEDVEQISSAYIALGEDGFVTFAKGNVDRNVNILDGRETFHGRCLIAIVTKTERLPRNHLFIFDLIIILK